MSTPEEMQAYLEQNLLLYLKHLRRMVSINSFTANPDGVNRLGRLTAELFGEFGFTPEFIQSINPNFGQHLILTRPGTASSKVGFVSHLDTVFPAAEEIRNDFQWRVMDDRIYGPGTADIKGGTVIMYMMLDAIRTFAPDVFAETTWVLLIDASEESMADDFGALCRERLGGPETRAALIFEAGFMEENKFWIVRSRKGMGVFNVAVSGKAAHAGSAHQQGANAIVQMADTIRQLADLTDYGRDVTVNVGHVAGGTVTNRVPHYAEAGLEMRAFDPGIFDQAVAAIEGLSEKVTVRSSNGGYPCQVAVEMIRRTPPWPRNDETERLFRIWQEAAADLGFQIRPEDRGGLSDGNHFWHAVPSLDGLGISGGNAHCSERSEDGSKDQEYCVPASLVPKTMLNVTALLKLLAG